VFLYFDLFKFIFTAFVRILLTSLYTLFFGACGTNSTGSGSGIDSTGGGGGIDSTGGGGGIDSTGGGGGTSTDGFSIIFKPELKIFFS